MNKGFPPEQNTVMVVGIALLVGFLIFILIGV